MPSASVVTPAKWKDLVVLYDDGQYSIVAGRYEGRPRLGERWNGRDGDLGFPNVAGHPVWHVVPEFLRAPVLLAILQQLACSPDRGDALAVMNELAAAGGASS